jgi:hypothetical protein
MTEPTAVLSRDARSALAAERRYGAAWSSDSPEALHAPTPQTALKARKELGMTNYHAPENRTARRVLLIMGAIALAVALTVALPESARADDVTPPRVPSDIEVPAGNTAFLQGHAVGTQNYICLPTGWTFVGPQATLFDDLSGQVTTHFLSPNPDENGTPRATWQHSQDTSTVWAVAIASYSNPGFVARGDIPLLLLRVVGAQDGPTGGQMLTATTFIHRLNTSGGVAPSTGCTTPSDVGKRAFVPYTADYFFYRADDRN